jgi:FkbM family methyltransferase
MSDGRPVQASWSRVLRALGHPTLAWRRLRHRARMRRFFAPFLPPGSLCFDVGAHRGAFTQVFLSLGARVVAVEPQSACARLLERRFARHRDFTLVQAAVAEQAGAGALLLAEPDSVATLSPDFAQALVRRSGVHYAGQERVALVTLEALCQRFGRARFIKLDVEGGELPALRGLHAPVPAVGFEYTVDQRAAALACVARLAELDDYEFNHSPYEHFDWPEPWVAATVMQARIADWPATFLAGDVYARRVRAQAE